jgi:hypothetical protein
VITNWICEQNVAEWNDELESRLHGSDEEDNGDDDVID